MAEELTRFTHAPCGICAVVLAGLSLTACSAEPDAGQATEQTGGPARSEPALDQASATVGSTSSTPTADQSLLEPAASIEIKWSQLPGKMTDIGIGGVGEDESIWAVGSRSVPGGSEIHYWNGSEWETVGGGAVAIDVDPYGYPWIVDSANRIFTWTGEEWAELPGRARDIGVGADGSVWIIGMEDAPGGYAIFRWTETSWEEVPGGGVAIDVYAEGDPVEALALQSEPWIVDEDNRISRWTGSEWSPQPGEAQEIGVGANGAVWIIGTEPAPGGYNIATWNGEGWTAAPGGGVRISVSANGFPYVITGDQELLQGM